MFSLLLGYPLAYFLSFYAGKRKDLLYQMVIIPLWVSYLVRAYAWKTILGSDGVFNTLLQYVHLTKHPLDFLLYSPFAVVLTLTHIYTPFTFLPIYAALEHIPRNLVEASHDLGATPAQTFWKVIFPLSIPGVLAGATFAFVLSLGDFLAPQLFGGPSGIMISNIVVSLFGAAYNWPLGAAISLAHAGDRSEPAGLLGTAGKEMELLVSGARTPAAPTSPVRADCLSTPRPSSHFSIFRSPSSSFIPSTDKASAASLPTTSRSTGIESCSPTARSGIPSSTA